ncbi:MAG: ATP/GTP-binding protein [Promethearchaeota archaeon]
MNLVYFIGTAGSGKSTLTGALWEYVQSFNPELDVVTLNLDPGVRVLPYQPDIDVREFVSVDEVIERYELGPNGALVVATDLIVGIIDEITDELDEYNDPDYVLVDTPGQMELFAYRNVGQVISRVLGEGQRNAVAFLFDPNLCNTPTGFLSSLLLATSVQYRFLHAAQVNVLSKIDVFEREVIDRVLNWSEDYEALVNDASEHTRGVQRLLNMELSGVFRNLGETGGLVPASVKLERGLDGVFGRLQVAFVDERGPHT